MTKRLPLAFLAVLLIVLLAGLGVAYGLWSETLTVSGTVYTGNVDVQFADVKTWEKVYDYNLGKEIDEPEKKANAANCTSFIQDAGTDEETLVVTAEGAYPSWRCYVEFYIQSVGSVPVHVFKPKGAVGNPTWPEISCDFTKSYTASESASEELNWGWPPQPPSYIQLHKGEKVRCQLKVHFDNEDGVAENATYTFTYTILAKQWNE
ncbi:hypothetical protein SE15_00490 [Thermanaerothrix daxensis]|uniref:SipW-cognate class signal peptide n=1 Tax=Thermanaerothrix daxensis TaxID=869279 RepID=A0A0P6XJW5_9CHLR|nr:hypothetical protein [Thermanaerothrix daxensis]KPL83775.1 hypothetical protein SE15_00490 [Thermanaerothrix daxensis]